MRKFIFSIVCLLFWGIGTSLKAQQIDSMMSVYAEGFPKEKIHIHFDRPVYNTGDTLFYKVYLLAANEPSMLSKNLYVEWYDTTGTLIKQTVAPLFQSTARGSFEIPAKYSGGFLHVKAFTRWMLNDDPAYLFQKNIPINGGNVVLGRMPSPTRVDIFPESGSLVEGVNSRVAFKAINQIGLPVKIKGVLIDAQKKVLDSLKVQHDGMGLFVLKPLPGQQYQLNWTDEYGRTGTTPIKDIKKEGVVLTVRTNNEKAFLQFERSEPASANFKQMNLLVHMNQSLLYKVGLKMSERNYQRAEIPIDELPTGIVQFTLFTADWIPVAERIVFINNHTHDFNAKINPIVTNLGKRALNKFDIFVSDTTMTNMSVAVIDANANTNDPHSIFSNFLLASEIKGYVHNPSYYFQSDADSIMNRLDLVMMTNGWRKINWEKLKEGIGPQLKYMPETEYMSLKGSVFGIKPVMVKDQQLNFVLAAKDSSKTLQFAAIDANGNFEQPGIFFYDTVKVYYGFNNNSKLSGATQVKIENGLLRKENGAKVGLGAIPPVWGGIDSMAIARMNFYLTEQEKLRKLMASASLSEVVVKTRTKSKLEILDETYSSGLFSGMNGYSFDLTDGTVAALDIFTFLQGRVAGLQVTGTGPSASLTWRGGMPDIYLNELRSDIPMVANIPIADIAYLKVFRPPFFGTGAGGGSGAIVIYTKKGGTSKGSQNVKGLESTLLSGYSTFKEFYNPIYDKTTVAFEPDTRNTLYWNPYIITNKKSPRYPIEFYNNDVSTKLKIVLEGFNASGKMTRVERILE
ncbi:hypothetical protein [Sediminibacterium sp. TEGAF015]|uniref:hypothetical protein n=1 Tax=Sediminibacterium sp. TEGAF015 TaxID=575378 RepID=UPI0021FD8926|nr:hypothetical protein [Sediminibacterium sp. TEGAF015]BDQ11212.1 hypothetical protein TEGAF0_04290 [Sediminibacterium sp. TEGAF015]